MTTYYTYDPIQLPFASLWRLCWRLYWFAAPLVFLYLALRKLLRLRRAAYWGSPRPERIDPLAATALPFIVRNEFEPAERACQAAGMRHVYYTTQPRIGGKEAYAATYLSADGAFYAGIVWTRFSYRGQTQATTVFACHTRLGGGGQFHTSAMPAPHLTADIIPPDHEILRMPPGTSPEEVITRHIERVHEASGVLRLREDNLVRLVLDDAQQLFDRMVEKGHYVPLTEKEVARLTSEAADMDRY
jgi:hypothetical protein